MAALKTADQEFNERFDGVRPAKRDTSDANRRLAGRNRAPADATRNARMEVRTSSMPGAPKNSEFATDKRDIATEFNESYAKQGIQPSYAANDNEAPKRRRYQQPEQITRSQQTSEIVDEFPEDEAPQPKKTYKRRRELRKKLGAKSAVAKARVTGVNVWVWSWGLWAWFFFQLPFAVISTMFAALTEFVYQLFVERTLFKSTEPGLWAQAWNIIVDGVARALSVFASIVISIMEWFGIDLSFISPANMFLLTYLVALGIGWFTLMLIYFQYKIAFLHPLGGEKAGMKMGLCLLAIIGYATPIANLFPWFIFWTMAVWFYPK